MSPNHMPDSGESSNSASQRSARLRSTCSASSTSDCPSVDAVPVKICASWEFNFLAIINYKLLVDAPVRHRGFLLDDGRQNREGPIPFPVSIRRLALPALAGPQSGLGEKFHARPPRG